MNKVVLDSCVFSKLFLQEPDHQEAVELITEFSQRNIKVLVLSLFLYEVLSIAVTNPFPIENSFAISNECQFITADKRHVIKTKQFVSRNSVSVFRRCLI